jgi:hypothetical protein
MKKLLIGIVALFLSTGMAHAQREGGAFFGPFSRGSSMGGAPGGGGYARPINISPTTGRTYSTEADYPKSKHHVQRKSKRK